MRSAITALDHLVLATPDLEATAAWVEKETGVIPTAGGQHVGRGTRNMLCSFEHASYLEIIGPDPEQPPPDGARPFGIDDLSEPRVVSWAIAVIDIEAAVETAKAANHDPGSVASMQRERPDGLMLSWKLTLPPSTAIPFLIDWGDSRHPSVDASPGMELVEFQAQHPDPGHLANTLSALGVFMGIEHGNEALLVTIRGPLGTLEFA